MNYQTNASPAATALLTIRTIKTWLVALCMMVAGVFCTTLFAQETEFVEGVHYQLLREAQPVQSGDKIEVVEMFWYECPHCYRLEPYMKRWLKNKPENAEFVPVPAVLNDVWRVGAQIYYTLAALNLHESLNEKVFTTIHEARRPLKTMEQFADWGVDNGIDRKELLAAANSFAVQNKINFASVMSRKYGITGVPAIIVDGKYRTSVSTAGGHDRLLEVINYLVDLAAEQRAQ